MTIEGRLAVGFLLASAAAYFATPAAIAVASRLGFYDQPAGYKAHGTPTPYLGGAAVMGAFVLALILLAGDMNRTAPIVAGVAVLWAIGTIDDRRTLTPALRIVVEVGVAAGLWALGHGWALGLGGLVDLVATALWVVAVVNAFNLFDNMDGASGTMAAIIAGAVAVLGATQGDAWVAGTGAALAGACCGFLPHNLARPRARIFLGDGGSMPIGFAVAALVMIGASEAVPEWQALLIGLLLVGVPALDTALVIVSRRRRGVTVLTGGRDHLTHRTNKRLRSARGVAAALGGIQALVAALALVAVQGGSAAIVVVVLVYLAAAGAAIAVLEAEEGQVAHAGEGAVAPPPLVSSVPAWLTWGLLATLGLGAALSPLWSGYYDSSLWVPLGIGVVTLSAAAALASPPRLSRAGLAALGGLAALAAWALASGSWAESVERAVVDGNRLLVLAAVLGAAATLIRDDRLALWLVGVLGAGVAAVAGVVLVRMLGDDPGSLFLAGRLNQPLAYINAEATVFAMGAWVCFAAAERRHAIVAGIGLGSATVLSGLVLLSQSRGAALAVIGSALAVLAVVPGRRRRLSAIVVAAAGVAASGGPLLEIYHRGQDGTLPAGTAHAAAGALLAAGVVAGVVWGLITAYAAHALPAGTKRSAATVRVFDRGVGAVAMAVLIALVLFGGRIGSELNRQYDTFVHVGEPGGSVVTTPTGSSRLVSGSGNRYDYWRIARNIWRDHPLKGVGAGNYDRAYFAQRSTSEDVRQPHSIELQALSETGVVGLLALLVFLAGLAAGARQLSRAARDSVPARTAAVAAVGGVTAWAIHTSVDWMHLLPGVTAIALCLAAILVRARAEEPGGPTPVADLRLAPVPVVVAVAVAGLVVVSGASLARQGLAEHYRGNAQSALIADPRQALRDANRSLRLDDEAVSTWYVKAAALARFDDPAGARAALSAGLRREPANYLTWALLGDLAVRTGDLAQARRDYGRAHRLNPREPSLAALSRNPAAPGVGKSVP